MIQYVFLHQAGYLLSQRSILLALLRSVSDLLFVTAHWRMEVYVVWLFALPKLWLRIRAQPKAAHMMQCLTYLWWPLPTHAPGARMFFPPSFRRGIISAAPSKRADAAVPAVESFLTLKFLKICNAEYVKKFFRMYMTFWTMLSHMCLCSRLQHQVRLNRADPVLMSLSSWARPLQEADGSLPKRQAAGSEKFLMKGIQILTKLALKNAMDFRELQAASLLTVQLPKDNAFVVNMLKATKMFNDEQEKAKSSGSAPP